MHKPEVEERIITLFQQRQKLGYPYHLLEYGGKERTFVIFTEIHPFVGLEPWIATQLNVNLGPTIHHLNYYKPLEELQASDITQDDAPYLIWTTLVTP